MGGRNGRRPTPTALKLLRGVRPSRINWNEPQPAAERPPKPGHLEGIASVEWDRLIQLTENMQILTLADGPALEMCCSAYAEYRHAAQAAAEAGSYYEAKTSSGATMIRTHPAVAAAGDSWRRYFQALGSFGLSPATRSKVAKAPPRRLEIEKYFEEPTRDPRDMLKRLK